MSTQSFVIASAARTAVASLCIGGMGVDLPLNFHPAAVRASAVCEPPPNVGPPEARVFRLHSGGGLVARPEFTNEIGTLLSIAP
ncbi:hypothetical protein LPU83_pLPU83b_0126 (plasmid) [Rhizobium favelukesii]|uniref:Uncharacterized protein n=1 Tax=Rhizobium favelukesii TaxID=348824 RepID=W6RFV6_9HYPH|nr:hypothetical protein LPU83_pLPU83b_0126 [Rhizobium favelukesii]